MLRKLDSQLSNYLLTQSAINMEMPYDVIEEVIQEAIQVVKKQVINAIIMNVVFNINNQLVPAQIYVERQNGFVPVPNNPYGTSPTAYKVQVRFPFGIETRLGQERVFLPSGDFIHILQPYRNKTHVLDDVQRNYELQDIVCGRGVEKIIKKEKELSTISLSIPDGESITFDCKNEIGKGFSSIGQQIREYYELQDYKHRLKMAGVYPLFYANRSGIIKKHTDYQGYTIHQGNTCELRNDGQAGDRQKRYKKFIEDFEQKIIDTPIGKRWISGIENSNQQEEYILDITIINGIPLFTESGLPVTRLRDYQVGLFQKCSVFLEQLTVPNKKIAARAGIINMGVGAGKTFSILSLLKYIKYKIQTEANYPLSPPFCMAPDIGVATVIQKAINRQGLQSGMSAIAITEQGNIPNSNFLNTYEKLAANAAITAKETADYVNKGLQEDILDFCQEKSMHPFTYTDRLYIDKKNKMLEKFKDTIDPKRLILIVEGYKKIMSKTNMLSMEALNSILENFKTIQVSLQKDSDFVEEKVGNTTPESINYNQQILITFFDANDNRQEYQKNLTQLSKEELLNILRRRWLGNIRQVRDSLMRIAFFGDVDAAVLLANLGGLGNTHSDKEIHAQIDKFLPIAMHQFQLLINKEKKNNHDHYTLYMYLKEIFINIPEKIKFKNQAWEAFNKEYVNHNIQLIEYIKNKIEDKIKTLDFPAMKEAHQLAGKASLAIAGRVLDDNEKLLLTHISVFTPEGLACYLEYLVTLEGHPVVNFSEQQGIYKLNKSSAVYSKKDIQTRLRQILSTVMIADEVHKKEFEFLYNITDPIYIRINKVTQTYLKENFINLLPPRIGMSGTVNQIALNAFDANTIYNLSISQMMQQGLMKKTSIDSICPEEDKGDNSEEAKKSYAIQVVVDYFAPLSEGKIADPIDLFRVSKGLIFSKKSDVVLNRYINHFFNLLIQEHPQEKDATIKNELFKRINQRRPNNKEFNPEMLKKIQRDAFENNLFALYLEYILSKSGSPKEMSDIVGWQNNFFSDGDDLISGILKKPDILSLITGIDSKSITQEDVSAFIKIRIKDPFLQIVMINNIVLYKEKYKLFIEQFRTDTKDVQLNALLTNDRNEFESGKTLIMLGSEAEQTGYSHEPVGIIVDVPTDSECIMVVNQYISQLKQKKMTADDLFVFLIYLKRLTENSFSYHEKNQIGGRALRTPHGHVRYVQYESAINSLLKNLNITDENPLALLKVETSFEDIFTANEALAQQAYNGVTFNRVALFLLEKQNLPEFCRAVAAYFNETVLRHPDLRPQYQRYISQRLPLLWAMKHQPQMAVEYLIKQEKDILTNILNIHAPTLNIVDFFPVPERPVEKTTLSGKIFLPLAISASLGLVSLVIGIITLALAFTAPWVSILLMAIGIGTVFTSAIYNWQIPKPQPSKQSTAIILEATGSFVSPSDRHDRTLSIKVKQDRMLEKKNQSVKQQIIPVYDAASERNEISQCRIS